MQFGLRLLVKSFMNVLVLHDTCTELVSYCSSCCLVHQLSSLSGMLSTINRVSSKTEHTVIAKCPLVNTTLRYSRQDLHSLVQQNFQLIDMPRCLVLKIFSRLRRRCLRNSCAAYASVTGRFSAKQGDVGALGHKARSMMESESYDRSY